MVFICKIISRNFNLYYYHFILLHFLGATAAALRFGQPSLVLSLAPGLRFATLAPLGLRPRHASLRSLQPGFNLQHKGIYINVAWVLR